MAIDRTFEQLQRDLLSGGDLSFQATDGIRPPTGTDARETVRALATQIGQLAESATAPTGATASISQAAKAASKVGSLSSVTGDLGKASGNFLLKGLTLAPLINGLLGLFRRDSQEETAAPIRFSLPPPMKTEAGLAPNGQTVSIDRGAGDRIRPVRPPETGPSPLSVSQSGVQSGGAFPQNITVQVNAMDSRSFLDHSEDIARAVRDAMLHSHALNDVVNDL